jgi:hypothetical protein
MGAKSNEGIKKEISICVIGNKSPVAQLLHPLCIARDDISIMSDILQRVDQHLSEQTKGVKLVVSGGGFIEINHHQTYISTTWRSPQTLKDLKILVQTKIQPVATALKHSKRDYIIGVDVFDTNDKGGGQFAVLIRKGKISAIVWKSYPTVKEDRHLAGFGTDLGLNSPRIVDTNLGKVGKVGKAILLICHDSQAYNPRSKATASRPARLKVIEKMENMIKENNPEWAFNLIHRIDKEGSIKTFRTSYIRIHKKFNVPSVIGAFGYSEDVREILTKLAEKTQYPNGKASVVVILE